MPVFLQAAKVSESGPQSGCTRSRIAKTTSFLKSGLTSRKTEPGTKGRWELWVRFTSNSGFETTTWMVLEWFSASHFHMPRCDCLNLSFKVGAIMLPKIEPTTHRYWSIPWITTLANWLQRRVEKARKKKVLKVIHKNVFAISSYHSFAESVEWNKFDMITEFRVFHFLSEWATEAIAKVETETETWRSNTECNWMAAGQSLSTSQ